MSKQISFVIQRDIGADFEDGISKLLIESGPAATSCKDEEVIVAVKACCINYPDIMRSAGQHQHTPRLPFIHGMEYSGQITAIGAKVSKVKVGDSVMVAGPGMTTQAVVRESDCHMMPQGFSYPEGASFLIGFMTAYHCLIERGNLKAGETCLVHGATGGMGFAAVQIAKCVGARVIATGGSDDKLDIVKRKAGADEVINYNDCRQFSRRVKDVTAGWERCNEGADVIFDPVGGHVFDQSIKAAAWGGRILVVGFTSGVHSQPPTNLILIKGLSIIGCRAGEYIRRAKDGMDTISKPRMNQLGDWARKGKICPFVSHEFPLSQVRDAFHCVLNRRVIGRCCVNMEIDDPVFNSAKL